MAGMPGGVGWTALLTAYGRAQESRRTDRLFEDPLAMAFVTAVTSAEAASGRELPRLGPAVDDGSSPLWNMLQFMFCGRTPFYDQHILDAVAAGCHQVVLLGAGLDSRAFRLNLPEKATVFELDQSAVLDFKQSVLDRHGSVAACHRVPLAVDLRGDWRRALSAAGFDEKNPTIWVAEGLLMYLSLAEADDILAMITTLSAPGSRFVSEYLSGPWPDSAAETVDESERRMGTRFTGNFRYGPAGMSPGHWLDGHGWTLHGTTTITELGDRHGRAVPRLLAMVGAPHVWLFDATISPAVPALTRVDRDRLGKARSRYPSTGRQFPVYRDAAWSAAGRSQDSASPRWKDVRLCPHPGPTGQPLPGMDGRLPDGQS